MKSSSRRRPLGAKPHGFKTDTQEGGLRRPLQQALRGADNSVCGAGGRRAPGFAGEIHRSAEGLEESSDSPNTKKLKGVLP